MGYGARSGLRCETRGRIKCFISGTKEMSSFCLLRSRQKEQVPHGTKKKKKKPERDQVVIEARKRAKEMVFGVK